MLDSAGCCTTDMLSPTSCIVIGGWEKREEHTREDTYKILLLLMFVLLLGKGWLMFIAGEFTTMEVSGTVWISFELKETKVFFLEGL